MDDHTKRNAVDPTNVNWNELDKTKFYFYGTGMYAGTTAMVHPLTLAKTRLQVIPHDAVDRNAYSVIKGLLKSDGIPGMYKGLGTLVIGSTPARMVYMTTLEMSKAATSKMIEPLRLSQTTQATIANGVAGTMASTFAQTIYAPVDVVGQRLMVQGCPGHPTYSGGLDVLREIIKCEGIKGLYRGFGLSLMAITPSHAVWWACYSASQHMLWRFLGHGADSSKTNMSESKILSVQPSASGLACAASTCISAPLDTIKTRLQVTGHEKKPTIKEVFRNLIAEDGWNGLYRGLGAKSLGTTVQGTLLLLAYEYLKRFCAGDK